jgi:hypothetical protein
MNSSLALSSVGDLSSRASLSLAPRPLHRRAASSCAVHARILNLDVEKSGLSAPFAGKGVRSAARQCSTSTLPVRHSVPSAGKPHTVPAPRSTRPYQCHQRRGRIPAPRATMPYQCRQRTVRAAPRWAIPTNALSGRAAHHTGPTVGKAVPVPAANGAGRTPYAHHDRQYRTCAVSARCGPHHDRQYRTCAICGRAAHHTGPTIHNAVPVPERFHSRSHPGREPPQPPRSVAIPLATTTVRSSVSHPFFTFPGSQIRSPSPRPLPRCR